MIVFSYKILRQMYQYFYWYICFLYGKNRGCDIVYVFGGRKKSMEEFINQVRILNW